MPKRGQESLSFRFVAAEGKDLFELIHGDHGSHPLTRCGRVSFAQLGGKCPRLSAQLVGQRCDLRPGRVRPERASQLLEWVSSGCQQQDADTWLLPPQGR